MNHYTITFRTNTPFRANRFSFIDAVNQTEAVRLLREQHGDVDVLTIREHVGPVQAITEVKA